MAIQSPLWFTCVVDSHPVAHDLRSKNSATTEGTGAKLLSTIASIEFDRVSSTAIFSRRTEGPRDASISLSSFRFCRVSVACSKLATYGCESWTVRKNEETRLDAFEMKGLRRILRVSWTAKKTNEWVLNKAGVKRELLDTVKARKLAYYGHTMKKQGSCLEKEIIPIKDDIR